jgi:Rrf2 family protein
MSVSRKTQYALRALFELAKHHGGGPLKVQAIAEAQCIPARFLEVILSELKQAGFVTSTRGRQGGYRLVPAPRDLTVGQLVQFLEGPYEPVECTVEQGAGDCPLLGQCVFASLWEEVRGAVSGVYDRTTLQELLDREERMSANPAGGYAI